MKQTLGFHFFGTKFVEKGRLGIATARSIAVLSGAVLSGAIPLVSSAMALAGENAKKLNEPKTSQSSQSSAPSAKSGYPAVEFTDPANPDLQFRTVAPTKKGGIVVRALKADQNLPDRLELIVRDKDGNERKVELSALAPAKRGPKLPEFRGHFTPESGDWGSVMGFELRFSLPQAGGKKAIQGTKLDSPPQTP